MQEPELEENALTAKVAAGRLTIERRSIDPDPPSDAVVADPDGTTQTVKLTERAPGRADAALAAGTPGVWQVASGGMTAYAAAGAANPLELSDLRATATLVGKLVRQSGGGVHWLDTGKPGAAPDVPELRRTEPDSAASGGIVDRPGTPARPHRDRDHRAGPDAGLGGAAADARVAGAGLAAGGKLSRRAAGERNHGREACLPERG